MDSGAYAALDTYLRPWRRATVIAASVAVLELLALVGGAIYLFGRGVEEHAREAASRPAATPAPPARRPAPPPARVAAPKLARSETSVLVLNGNGLTGAAGAAAEGIRERGYLVSGVGDAPSTDVPRTTIMYRPGYRPASPATWASDAWARSTA
jgi:hypothetical protein